MTRSIAGWRLSASQRDALLKAFEPRYERTIADHVTLRYGTDSDTPLPTARSGEIIGEVDDGRGVQALIVRIGGTTDRGDGSHYHITWSLAPGREAKESNDILASTPWRRIDPPMCIDLKPDRWSLR